ncbi:MAG: hypothetical protein ACE5JJ_05185 [Nitrospinota bacterium]
MAGRPRAIAVALALLLAGCTASRALMVEPAPGRKPASRQQVYQAVVRAFSKAELSSYRELPDQFAVESDWTYWPDSWGSILWGFPATVWRYRATVKEKEVVLEAWGRGLNL